VMFFVGAGIQTGATIPSARNVDVVPTLLHLAGVKQAATVEGQAIDAILR
jgi:arylsulfatase A-like enzyme